MILYPAISVLFSVGVGGSGFGGVGACIVESSLRPCLAQLIFSFFTNLSRSFAKQLASPAAY
jgi:hypothetical protein